MNLLRLICIAIIAFGFVAGYSWHARRDRHNQDEAPNRGPTPKQARHGIGLPYTITGNPKGPGHQIYRFGDTWASSREDIIRFMTLSGWRLSPDYTPSDAVIRFVSDAPQHAPAGPQSTGWEKD
jgi:hypothetical protein